MWAYIYIAASVIPVYFGLKLLSNDPPPTKGVYQQKGKWFYLKYAAFWLLFNLRRWQNKRKRITEGESHKAGYGIKSRNTVEEMDRAQTLPAEHPKAVDAVYFCGGSREGTYLVAATARRHNNIVQTLLFLRIPEIGLLELDTIPNTYLKGNDEMTFAAGGLKLQPVEAMKKWRLTFDGTMRMVKDKKEVSVKFSVDWSATTGFFDFDTDMDCGALCEAMARETWSKEFFEALQVAHQTHYEQFGEMCGKVEIEGYNSIEIKCQGVRDHSYGNIRDWKDIHRYGIQYISLEDGMSICLGVICFPITMSRLLIGYVYHPDGRLETVSWTDFELHMFGDDGIPTENFQCKFKAGRKTYHLLCSVLDSRHFFIGEPNCARIHERMCTFLVNGVKGWGISEWDYRNDKYYSD